MSAFIEVDDLKFDYIKQDGTSLRAVDGISFRIERGSFTAIIGQNGSGKSTLAKNINALLLPTEGRILVDGLDTADPASLWEIRRRVAMVFQNPDNQIVSSIVEDDIAFGPENLGVDPAEIRQRVRFALKDVEMEEYRRKAPHLLSGGQKQRIATILITHFMEEAARADHVIVMNKGRLEMDGTPTEIFSMQDRLKELSLDVPAPIYLARILGERGVDFPPGIETTEELVRCLCQLQ